MSIANIVHIHKANYHKVFILSNFDYLFVIVIGILQTQTLLYLSVLNLNLVNQLSMN
jgi:hypothetical protein